MMRTLAIPGMLALGLTSGCFGTITTTPGQSEAIRIGDYQCTYRTDSTEVDVFVAQEVTTQDFIACQNGEDYACGNRTRNDCIAHVGAILAAIPKDAPPDEA
jgi:hypothetical protein